MEGRHCCFLFGREGKLGETGVYKNILSLWGTPLLLFPTGGPVAPKTKVTGIKYLYVLLRVKFYFFLRIRVVICREKRAKDSSYWRTWKLKKLRNINLPLHWSIFATELSLYVFSYTLKDHIAAQLLI